MIRQPGPRDPFASMGVHQQIPTFQNSGGAHNQSSILSHDDTGMTMTTNMLLSNSSFQAPSTNQPQFTDRFEI